MGSLLRALIAWNDNLSVGVNGLDKQHKQLISLSNELNDAMSQRKGKEVIGKVVNELVLYTLTHFKSEEKYFERFGYPDTDKHKQEHADFVEKVSEFQGKFEKGSLSLSIEVMSFLSNWLRTHIKNTDQKYSDFLLEHGVQ